ncbi:MAG: hypothetical protein K4304_01855 [Propionicimonas sp.]
MKRNGVLSIIFAIFLGLVLVAFFWMGLYTFYPEPDTLDGNPAVLQAWRLTSGLLMLALATGVAVVSLALPARMEAISNGLLLGSIFTLVSSVGMAFSIDNNVMRFVVVTAALLITVGIGYLRFGRRTRSARPTAPDPGANEASPGPQAQAPGVPAPATPGASDAELAARVAKLESRLAALRRALDEPLDI